VIVGLGIYGPEYDSVRVTKGIVVTISRLLIECFCSSQNILLAQEKEVFDGYQGSEWKNYEYCKREIIPIVNTIFVS
jgi:hypothetical protein